VTSPALPACIPTAAQQQRLNRRQKRRRTLSIRRTQLLENLILFAFFTLFFAIITVAAFS
jgi:hypothetical protein